MRGDQVVGKHGGVAITRDEQRAKAAAAAEARAQSRPPAGISVKNHSRDKRLRVDGMRSPVG